MDSLNFYYLHTFWTVVKEGGVVAAGEKLLLAQPTVSGQLRELEKGLGQPLFRRDGRRLALTETGRFAYRYADEIFALGRELLNGLEGLPSGRRTRLHVGVADVLPKAVVYKLLQPVMTLPDTQMVCHEGKADALLAELAMHRMDVVLSDMPLNPSAKIRAFSHLLGESAVSIVATEALAAKYRKGFPGSLHQAPFLLPTDNTMLRRSLEQWFDATGIRPMVKAEFEDSALLKFFGREGFALFPVATVVLADVCQQFGAKEVGKIDSVRERFYAISLERRVRHPAVVAISELARATLRGHKPRAAPSAR